MKKIKSILMAAALLSFCFNLNAKSIAGAARSAGGSSKPASSGRSTSSGSSYHSSSGDPCTDDCTEICALTAVELLALGWAALNLNVTYEDYPYQLYKPNYVINRSLLSKTVADETNEDADSSIPDGKSSRFSFDAEALKMNTKADDSGIGFAINFEGLIFPYVGPYCSFQHINDDEADSSENSLNNLKLGGQISIVQHDYLTANFFIQWSHWFGETKNTGSLKNGCVFGVECRSYPVCPLTIGWRGSWGSYGNDLTVIESDLQAGLIYRRVEFFAGWKYMAFGSDGNYSDEDARNGYYAGTRIHF